MTYVAGHQEPNDCGSGEPDDHQWAYHHDWPLCVMVCERCQSWAVFRMDEVA